MFRILNCCRVFLESKMDLSPNSKMKAHPTFQNKAHHNIQILPVRVSLNNTVPEMHPIKTVILLHILIVSQLQASLKTFKIQQTYQKMKKAIKSPNPRVIMSHLLQKILNLAENRSIELCP
jgi:hypothetical protein